MRTPAIVLYLTTQTFVASWATNTGPWWIDVIAVVTWAWAMTLIYVANDVIRVKRRRRRRGGFIKPTRHQ